MLLALTGMLKRADASAVPGSCASRASEQLLELNCHAPEHSGMCPIGRHRALSTLRHSKRMNMDLEQLLPRHAPAAAHCQGCGSAVWGLGFGLQPGPAMVHAHSPRNPEEHLSLCFSTPHCCSAPWVMPVPTATPYTYLTVLVHARSLSHPGEALTGRTPLQQAAGACAKSNSLIPKK